MMSAIITTMKFTSKLVGAIFAGITVSIAMAFVAMNFFPRAPLEVEVMRGTTGGASAIEYVRVKLTNYSGQDLTNVIVDMGVDDIQIIDRIRNGESILITPRTGEISRIDIQTAQGVSLTKYI